MENGGDASNLPGYAVPQVVYDPDFPFSVGFRNAITQALITEGVNNDARRERISQTIIDNIALNYGDLDRNLFQQMDVYFRCQTMAHNMHDPDLRQLVVKYVFMDQTINGIWEELIQEKLSATVFVKVPSSKDEDNFCCICQCTFDHGNIISELDCFDGHRFHYRCIKEWLMIKNKCPLCNEIGLDTMPDL